MGPPSLQTPHDREKLTTIASHGSHVQKSIPPADKTPEPMWTF